MAITTLPKRKPGVRRKRGGKVPTSADVPFVSPIQDPGLRAPDSGQVAAALGDVSSQLQQAAIARTAADLRLAKAQQRILDKQDINNSLILIDEFEQEEQKIFDALATDNKLGDTDFNEQYSEQVEQKFSAILEGSSFSNEEAKLDFQGKLLESRFKAGDTAGVKNSAALDERQMGIARKGLRSYQLDPARAGQGFSEVISGARAKLEADFAGSLSEESERTLMNEVVFEQFSPRFSMLIAGGSLNDARRLLNHPDVANVLSPQQFRAASQRIELVEAKRIETEVADNILFQGEADRLGIPVDQLTPSQKAGLKSSTKSPGFLAQEMFELAKLEHGTENPTSDQIKNTSRRNRAAVDPLKKIKDTLQVADGKQLNLLRFENREKAESDLKAINLGQNALESGAKPGSLVDMRTGIAKMLTLFGVSDESIASLNLGSAPMNEILGKSLADLALSQADQISRVTNMSIKLVREVWGTAGSTRDGLAIIFEMAENVARRDLAIADLAEEEAQRIQSGEPSKEELKPFNDQLKDLKREFKIFPEELAEKFKALAKKSKETKEIKAKKEIKATKGTGEFQVPEGMKLLGFVDNGKTAIYLDKAGKRKQISRELLVKFNESLKKKKPEPKKPVSAPRPTVATSKKSTPSKKKVEKLDKTEDIKNELKTRFPKIDKLIQENDIQITQGTGKNHAETFLKGEGESADPSKHIIEIRQTPFNKAEVAAAETLHVLGSEDENGPVNPEFFKLKQKFISEMTPRQKEDAEKKLKRFQEKGATGSNFENIENFTQRVNSDELIRMHLFPELMNTEKDRKLARSQKLLSPKQKQIINEMKSILFGNGKAATPTKVAPTSKKPIAVKKPGQGGIKKDVATKDKFSDVEAIIDLNQEEFETFISTTPADRRTAEVNKAISERLKGTDNKFLKEKEGFIAQARDIGDGRLTIGHGITSVAYKDLTGKTLTKETRIDKREASQLVRKFIQKVIKPEMKTLKLTGNKEEAVTSLIFNVGLGAWKKSRARKALLAGDIDKFLFEAFDPKIGFLTKNPKFLKGLQDRRAEERELFLKE